MRAFNELIHVRINEMTLLLAHLTMSCTYAFLQSSWMLRAAHESCSKFLVDAFGKLDVKITYSASIN